MTRWPGADSRPPVLTRAGSVQAAGGRDSIIAIEAGRFGNAANTPWVRTVVVLSIAQVVSELGFSFAMPFTPLFIQELGVTDVTEVGLWTGFMSGAFSVAMAVMAPIWGSLADRYGHKRMIQRAFFMSGMVIGAISLIQTPQQFFVLRLAHGMFTGVVTAIAALVSVSVPRQRLASVLGLFQAAQFLGISLGPLLGGMFSDSFGLRTSFMVTGVILITTGALVTLLIREPPRERHHPERETAPDAPKERTFLRKDVLTVISMIGIVRFCHMAPQPLLPLYVQQLVGSHDHLGTLVGLVLAATGAASALSALMVGRLTARFGRRPTLTICFILATLISPLQALVGGVGQLLALRTLLGLAIGSTAPMLQSVLVDLTPARRRGQAFGVLTTAHAAGSGLGPIAAGAVAAAWGIPAVFFLTTPVFAAAGWLVSRIRPKEAGPSNQEVSVRSQERGGGAAPAT